MRRAAGIGDIPIFTHVFVGNYVCLCWVPDQTKYDTDLKFNTHAQIDPIEKVIMRSISLEKLARRVDFRLSMIASLIYLFCVCGLILGCTTFLPFITDYFYHHHRKFNYVIIATPHTVNFSPNFHCFVE